jgi:hypothetical protein
MVISEAGWRSRLPAHQAARLTDCNERGHFTDSLYLDSASASRQSWVNKSPAFGDETLPWLKQFGRDWT